MALRLGPFPDVDGPVQEGESAQRQHLRSVAPSHGVRGRERQSDTDLFELIVDALAPLNLDTATDRGKRVYLAFTAARVGIGVNSDALKRVQALRTELGL